MIYKATLTLILLTSAAVVDAQRTHVRVRNNELSVTALAFVGAIPNRAEVQVLLRAVSDSKESAILMIVDRRTAFLDALKTFGVTDDDVEDLRVQVIERHAEVDTRSKWARRPPPSYVAMQKLRIYTSDLTILNDIRLVAMLVPTGPVENRAALTMVPNGFKPNLTAAMSMPTISEPGVTSLLAVGPPIAASPVGLARMIPATQPGAAPKKSVCVQGGVVALILA